MPWGWLVGDGKGKYRFGVLEVCARAGVLGEFLSLTTTSLLMKSLEIWGCGPSSMLIPLAMWRAGQLCKGSVLGCSLKHWELFGKYEQGALKMMVRRGRAPEAQEAAPRGYNCGSVN